MADTFDLNPDDFRRQQFKESSVETWALFNTGHHTTETLTPMHHFDKVGFKVYITTAETLDGHTAVFVPSGHDPIVDTM